MIWIFNLERASAGVCDNYSDLCQYILDIENQKNVSVTKSASKNYNPIFFNNEEDQKQWCIEFCKNHNYVIIETPSQPVNSEHAPWNSNTHRLHDEERFKQAS
jgi:hypothetical protein